MMTVKVCGDLSPADLLGGPVLACQRPEGHLVGHKHKPRARHKAKYVGPVGTVVVEITVKWEANN